MKDAITRYFAVRFFAAVCFMLALGGLVMMGAIWYVRRKYGL